jgi:twitching motility two-component system response regulator PilH
MANAKILVVEDSPTERFYLADLLGKKGYQVITAETGEEALIKVKSERPKLVVMDVVMPGQSGFQITRAITRDPETKDIPGDSLHQQEYRNRSYLGPASRR